MAGLEITRDPAALAFLLTEDLYAVAEKAAPAGSQPETGTSDTRYGQAGLREKAAGQAPSAKGAPEKRGQAPQKQKEFPEKPEELAEKRNETAQKREEVFHYLGENRRFVLVLVNYPEEEYMPEAERAYLEKVLSAVKLTPDDIALLNYARYSDRKYTELKDFFAFTTLLLFGVAPGLLQIPGPVLPYHLGLVEGIKILAADSTEVFRPDNGKKKPLWSELQKTFS